MVSFQVSPQHLRNGAQNASTITTAIGTHSVQRLSPGDLGHAGLAAALTGFQSAWTTELLLRKKAATEAKTLLTTAASDTEHIDRVLATTASRLGSQK